MPPNTVYVGRPTKWGNPFLGGSRVKMTADFYRWVNMQIYMGKYHDLEELRGKDLACWCPERELCHADVLLELANR